MKSRSPNSNTHSDSHLTVTERYPKNYSKVAKEESFQTITVKFSNSYSKFSKHAVTVKSLQKVTVKSQTVTVTVFKKYPKSYSKVSKK